MDHKEIANRLRNLIDATSNGIVLSEAIQLIADELDPPRPKPGTLVWWRDNSIQSNDNEWKIGEASYEGVWVIGSYPPLDWEAIEYKPAHILAPNEVAVKIPPVSEWSEIANAVNVVYETNYIVTNLILKKR